MLVRFQVVLSVMYWFVHLMINSYIFTGTRTPLCPAVQARKTNKAWSKGNWYFFKNFCTCHISFWKHCFPLVSTQWTQGRNVLLFWLSTIIDKINEQSKFNTETCIYSNETEHRFLFYVILGVKKNSGGLSLYMRKWKILIRKVM